MAEPEVIHDVDLRSAGEADTGAQESRFADERRAFWAMHAQLLKAYEGKNVAMRTPYDDAEEAEKTCWAGRPLRWLVRQGMTPASRQHLVLKRAEQQYGRDWALRPEHRRL